MSYIKLLVVNLFGILCVVSVPLPVENDESGSSTNSTEIDYRLPKNTVPIHYDLKFIPDLDVTFTFDGESAVQFEVQEPTWDISLHAQNLMLNESATLLRIKNSDINFRPEWYKHNNKTDILLIHFPSRLEVGEYILYLQFSGVLCEDFVGFYKDQYKDNEGNTVWLAATQFEAICARLAFPCWDEPAFKATFNISMKHHPNRTALSNMPVSQKSDVDEVDGKMWTHFERTPVMSTYLVAFVVADFHNISNADGTINAWSRKDQLPYLNFAHDIAQKAAKELECYTNSTVRVPKMDHVALPSHSSGAMENWGLITYPERNFVYKKDTATIVQKFEIGYTVVHELAHQWFGNVVSPTWWSHLWLNEGFASYFQYYIMDKIFNGSRIMDCLVMQHVQGSLSPDIHWHLNPIDNRINTPEQIDEAFSTSVYHKAPAILYMLSNIISPEVFQAGIVKYLDTHEYKSADSDCLWKALQSALDESDIPHTDFNLKEVMDTWIKQKGYPLIYVTRDYSAGTMTLVQKDFKLIDVRSHKDDNEDKDEDEDDQRAWWVPINYATESKPDFSSVRPTNWLKPNDNLTIDGINPDDWVIVNTQQSGYYRVNYDEVNWRKIARCLRSENFTNIHPLNRAQIINDMVELVMHGQVDRSIFLDVVTYLSQETDYLPYYPIFRYFYTIDPSLEFPSAEPIKTFILSVMDKLVNDVGFVDHENDGYLTIRKRTQTINWVCNLGHVGCRQAATNMFMKHLEDPAANKISPNQKFWMYTQALRSANETIWNKVFDWCVKNGSAEVFRTLAFTENPTLFAKYLNAALSNDTVISEDQKKLMVIHGVRPHRLTASRLDIILNFYEQRWDEIINRFGYDDIPFHEVLYSAYTKEQLEKSQKLCTRYNYEDCTTLYDNRLHEITQRNDAIKQWIELINNI